MAYVRGAGQRTKPTTTGIMVVPLLASTLILGCSVPSSETASEDLQIVNGSAQTLVLGDSMRLEAVVMEPLPRRLSGEVIWRTEQTDVIALAPDGAVTPRGVGAATVTAEYQGRSATVAIKVSSPTVNAPASLSLRPARLTLGSGQTGTLDALARGPGGKIIDDPSLQWRSSDTEVIAVESGRLVAGRPGEAVVTATMGDLSSSAAISVVASQVPPSEALNRAFPDAEGFGAEALVRCDRSNVQILRVTTTASTGPGSLASVLDQVDGNRLTLVLFAVGGTINGGVELRSGCVYLAGQTAPGDGIQVIGLNGNVAFRVDRFDATSDVVVRYMRFRSTKGGAGAQDAVSVHGGARMMFDHLSVQFGNDEVFSVEPVATNGASAADITISNTIIAAGLMPHSTGSLFMSPKSNESLSTSGLSLHRNLWSHNSHRNPAMGRLYDVQIVNNVMYNWKGNVGRMDRGTRADVIANTFLAGPWTTANGREDRIFQHDTLGALSSVYLEGNVARPYQPSPGGNQRVMVKYLAGGGLLPDEAYVEHRHAQPAVPLTVVGADQAATAILDEAGASRRLACDGSWVAARDPLDTRIVADVRAGTGPSQDSEIDHPSDLGGSPSLSAGTPCPDDDQDGMPNAYEARFEFDPLDAADASQDADGDGYLNIEEYLNGSEPR